LPSTNRINNYSKFMRSIVYSSISLPSGRWLEGRKTKNAGLLLRALFLMQADDCLVPTQKRCTTQLQHRDGCFHYFLGWATLWSTADLLRSVPFLLAACCGVGFAPRTRRSCCFLFVLVHTLLFFLLSPQIFVRSFFGAFLAFVGVSRGGCLICFGYLMKRNLCCARVCFLIPAPDLNTWPQPRTMHSRSFDSSVGIFLGIT
jgi:hypothetical protein